jgi:integrase
MTGSTEAPEQSQLLEEKDSPWEVSSVANLVRWKASKVYFARLKVNGKLIRKSLQTKLFSVAKNRLADLVKDERNRAEQGERMVNGKMVFADATKIYLQRLDADPGIKPRTKVYRRECIKAVTKTWPGIDELDVRKINKTACIDWAARFREKGTQFKPIGALKPHQGVSPSRFNNTVATLRQILDIPVEMGALYRNPVTDVKRAKERKTELSLPSRVQFAEFVKLIETSGAAQAKDCADLVRFLAFSGCRLGEAQNVRWHDVDWEKQELVVRGDPVTGTKNWEIRCVPMIPELTELLRKMRGQRPAEQLETCVLRVKECQRSMNRAAQILHTPRITHHDLRHLYATTAIESGIDIPTVAKLLGHKDGGALAMRVYGHLRQEHAKAAVQKIKFGL